MTDILGQDIRWILLSWNVNKVDDLPSNCFADLMVCQCSDSLEDGIVELVTTDLLSPNIQDGPSKGTPIILKVYCRSMICSVQVLVKVNSKL